MARRKQIEEAFKRKQELAEQLEASRIAMTYGRDLLKDQCNVKKRVGRTFAKHQSKFVMGSAVVGGLLTSLLLKKSKKKSANKKSVSGWVKSLIVGAIIKRVKAKAIDRARGMVIEQIRKRNSQ